MILGSCRPYIVGTVLACLTGPLLAAPPAAADGPAAATSAESQPIASAERRAARVPHSRQVELPFLLDSPSPEPAPRASVPQPRAGPHPFREQPLKRASASVPLRPAGRLSAGIAA